MKWKPPQPDIEADRGATSDQPRQHRQGDRPRLGAQPENGGDACGQRSAGAELPHPRRGHLPRCAPWPSAIGAPTTVDLRGCARSPYVLGTLVAGLSRDETLVVKND